MIPAPFDYVRPSSLEEALEALGEPEAKVLAGGQSLVPALKLRLARPALLVDVGGLDLRGVSRENGGICVGALATWDDLLGSEELGGVGLTAVRECAAGIGDLQVRNLGTLAGGLAHADPASDMPAVALALGMRLQVHSASGERAISADELFVGPFTTTLEPGELITDVLVPEPPPGAGSAYVSVENPASGFALAGAAALVAPDGAATVAVTGIAGRPLLLAGEREPEEALAEIEVFGHRQAPADHRRQLAAVVVRRAVALARVRADAGAP